MMMNGGDHDHHHHEHNDDEMRNMQDHSHHHDPVIQYGPLGDHEYYTPPPGFSPDYDHDHDHHHHSHDYEDYHHFSFVPPATTMAPSMMKEENRDTDKYSYYYIGRKLWYVPLYFSIYFIIYIAVIIAKSIARHRIQYPTHYKPGRSFSENDNRNEFVLNLASFALRMISEGAKKYLDNTQT